MYSVLLAEDEKSIRENLQKGIAWEKLGFYIAGDAANGEQALEQLETLQPDVLITDIRMPFMDGLELSRIAKGMLPDIRIVVLSGYMEFGYAREAISIGVEEYLVKPVTPVKLMRTFTALREKLDKERREQRQMSSLLKTMPDQERIRGDVAPEDLRGEGERERKLWQYLQEGTQGELDEFVEQYIKANEEKLLASTIYLYYFFVQTLVICMRAVEGLGGNPSEVFGPAGDIGKTVSGIHSEEDAKDALTRLFSCVLDYRDSAVRRSSGPIWKAETYIREHFREESLTLSDAAAYAGLSVSHFSYAFKRKTGQGFTHYLTQLRLEEAQRLLRQTDESVSGISERVGYANVNYFSAVFHRQVGCTPKEYRETKNNEENS
ncbi:MAG: helix-turn-helix domain-containing protein [Clostridia bacterium]|nr:helix-turn-helix domain-containing protein [Clostridia bacterium]